MQRKWIVTLLANALVTFAASCSKKSPSMTTPPTDWPSLSEFPAVTGRPATQQDVSAGHAVFVLQDSGRAIGESIPISLPQYAWHTGDDGLRTPCILIQAEQARGQQLGGAVMLPERGFMAGMFTEFHLLGTTPPLQP